MAAENDLSLHGALDGALEVMRGTWLYAGEVPCNVLILKTDMYYGTQDPQDPPEVRNDAAGEFYYVQYESPVQCGYYHYPQGPFESLMEAVQHVESAVGGDVSWIGEGQDEPE